MNTQTRILPKTSLTSDGRNLHKGICGVEKHRYGVEKHRLRAVAVARCVPVAIATETAHGDTLLLACSCPLQLAAAVRVSNPFCVVRLRAGLG